MVAPTTSIDWPALRRIIVFRALQLGDMLCAVPALRALRRAAPRAHITLAGLPWARSFARRYAAYVDDFLAFPGYTGLPERAPDCEQLPLFLQTVQRIPADLALQLHGSGAVSNAIVQQFGASLCAGFADTPATADGSGMFLPWDETEHEVLRYLRLLRFLGIETHDSGLEFPFAASDEEELRAAGVRIPGEYACVHAGARMPSRRWPPERFAQVADELAAQGLTVVLTGSQEERALVNEVQARMAEGAINLAGRTSLGALVVLLARARLLVCNDTGVSHLAAATRTPSVVLCCGSDPRRWAPLDGERHRVLAADVACRPCAHHDCPIGHPCAWQIGTEAVIDLVRGLVPA